jgi:hypothetical protein
VIRNLKNEEAMTSVGSQRYSKKKKSNVVCVVQGELITIHVEYFICKESMVASIIIIIVIIIIIMIG